MVDDVLCVTKCSSSAITSNATINSFMELNKLKLSAGKCSKIHIGKKCEQCPKLMVHEKEMKSSAKEKAKKGHQKTTLKTELQKHGHM